MFHRIRNRFPLGRSVRAGAVRRMRSCLRYPYPSYRSCSEKAAPVGETGGACVLADFIADLDAALMEQLLGVAP
jgi:hypothetical protein